MTKHKVEGCSCCFGKREDGEERTLSFKDAIRACDFLHHLSPRQRAQGSKGLGGSGCQGPRKAPSTSEDHHDPQSPREFLFKRHIAPGMHPSFQGSEKFIRLLQPFGGMKAAPKHSLPPPPRRSVLFRSSPECCTVIGFEGLATGGSEGGLPGIYQEGALTWCQETVVQSSSPLVCTLGKSPHHPKSLNLSHPTVNEGMNQVVH